MRTGQLRITAAVVAAMVIIDALITPVILLWNWLAPENYTQFVTPVAQTVDAAALIFAIVTMVLFARWIYLAGANLAAARYDDLHFTPASRIWWFAVPVANLFKPFEGMRELWNASHGELQYERNHSLVTAWWAVWIANGMFNWLSSFMARGGTPTQPLLIGQSVLGIASATIGIMLLFAITRAQARPSRTDLANIFA